MARRAAAAAAGDMLGAEDVDVLGAEALGVLGADGDASVAAHIRCESCACMSGAFIDGCRC